MIAYLESDDAAKPRTIDEAAKKPDPKAGRVTCNIRHGEVFLHPKGKPAERIRLRWEPGGDPARELPAGTYEVSGYRHVAKAEDGAVWIWSTTSPVYRELSVEAAKTVGIDVRQKVVVKARAFEKKGKHRVGLVFLAEPKLGNTLYRNGKRIDIRWECLDEKGAVLSEGKMRYG